MELKSSKISMILDDSSTNYADLRLFYYMIFFYLCNLRNPPKADKSVDKLLSLIYDYDKEQGGGGGPVALAVFKTVVPHNCGGWVRLPSTSANIVSSQFNDRIED